MFKIGLGKGCYIIHPESPEDRSVIDKFIKSKQVIIKDASLLLDGKSEAMDSCKHVLYMFREQPFECINSSPGSPGGVLEV